MEFEQLNPELTPNRAEQYVDTRDVINQLLQLKSGGKSLFGVPVIEAKSSHRGAHLVSIPFLGTVSVADGVFNPAINIRNSYDGRVTFAMFVTVGGVQVTPVTRPTSGQNVAEFVIEQARGIVNATELRQLIERTLTLEEQQSFIAQSTGLHRKTAIVPYEGLSAWHILSALTHDCLVGVQVEGSKKSRQVTRVMSKLSILNTLFTAAMGFVTPTEVEQVQTDVIVPAEEVAPDVATDVQIPKRPAQYIYEGPNRSRRTPNPAYTQWIELYADLV